MKIEELYMEATRFRKAIEKARDWSEFHKNDRMRKFPHDCCDDTADLFTNYIYHTCGIDSLRVDRKYYDG